MLFLISNPINILYITGYKASSENERETFCLCVYNKKQNKFQLVYHFIPEMLWQNVINYSYQKNLGLIKRIKLKAGEKFFDQVLKKVDILLRSEKLSHKQVKLFIEFEDLKLFEFLKLKKRSQLQKRIKIKFYKADNVLKELRMSKSSSELEYLKKSVEIAEKKFIIWKKGLKLGINEKSAKEKLIKLLESEEDVSLAFEPIIAFGKNSAIPHHIAGDDTLKIGDIVLVDWGVNFKTMNSDMTRTFIFKGKNSIFEKRVRIVKYMYNKLYQSLNKRASIKDALEVYQGFGKKYHKNILHSLGHGIGMQVHEYPYFTKLRKNALDYKFHKKFFTNLPNNTVIALEPGLYFPGWGGIRLEKTLLLSHGKVEELGNLSWDI